MPNIKHIVSGMVANSVRIHNYSEIHSYSLATGDDGADINGDIQAPPSHHPECCHPIPGAPRSDTSCHSQSCAEEGPPKTWQKKTTFRKDTGKRIICHLWAKDCSFWGNVMMPIKLN